MASDAFSEGSLLPDYAQAATRGALALGSYRAFVGDAGVALKGTEGRVLALLPIETAPAATTDESSEIRPAFEGAEHTAIGDAVILRFTRDDPGRPGGRVPLEVQPGLSLTYGQIVSLGGDFYGVPDRPIADGASPQERKTRFGAWYDSLAKGSIDETRKILAIMQNEIDLVKAALAAGRPASEAYDKLGNTLSGEWNMATGGGGIVEPWVPFGRYMLLSEKNWDHFGRLARLAYQAGHAVALDAAIEGHRATDPRRKEALLVQAYAMNAFSDHFLTDLFSAGHIRNPRKEIYQTAWVKETANLCVKGMHDEDCKFGVRVSNAQGTAWLAYGDKRYFDAANTGNKTQIGLAVQASATEVFMAFLAGAAPTDPESYAALRFVPDIAQAMDHRTNPLRNFTPMFVLEGKDVHCRRDLNNLTKREWYANWNGAYVAWYLNYGGYKPQPPPRTAGDAESEGSAP